MERHIQTLGELYDFADLILNDCVKGDAATVLALTGDLGAGKTAFVKAIAKKLGIATEITSPTFVIMKSYKISSHPFLKTLIHIDAYRIESDDEMRVLKFDEILRDPHALVCIEWPERIERLIPSYVKTVALQLNPDGSRAVIYGV